MVPFNFAAGQTVRVKIFGQDVEVKIYSLDSKYIYFVDPTFANNPLLKNKLFARKRGLDIITFIKK